VSYTHSH